MSAEKTITVTLTQERFEAVQWAISMGINLRNMAVQEALIEASNDFGRAALDHTTDQHQPDRDRFLKWLRRELDFLEELEADDDLTEIGEAQLRTLRMAAEEYEPPATPTKQHDPEDMSIGAEEAEQEMAERKVVISFCGGPLDGRAGFAPDTRPIQFDHGTYRNAGQHPEGGHEFEWERTYYPTRPTPEPEVEQEGPALIAAERRRQIEQEGWTPEHDDQHDRGELAQAAAAYALVAGAGPTNQANEAEALWPFDDDWKPSEDEVRDLIKAGALIAAEIDRLRRLEEQ